MVYVIISYKMPRKAINYQNTEIYKIVCDALTVKYCYVGSTTDFTKRKYSHKTGCNNEKGKSYNYRLYTTIRENGGWDNWTMVLIEKYPCENKQQAEQRERFWYEQLNAELNMIRPHRTEEERKEYHNEAHKKYYQANQEYYKDKRKEYQQANKDRINKQRRERRALKKQLSAQ